MHAADRFFYALADKVRRRILALLLQEDEVCVCELVAILRLPQPAVSRHLRVLRDGGIVTARRTGTWVFYRLSAGAQLWAYRIVESMVHGASGDAVFIADAANLRRRPVRHADMDRAQRKAGCTACSNSGSVPSEGRPRRRMTAAPEGRTK